jgi:hypothetical protein
MLTDKILEGAGTTFRLDAARTEELIRETGSIPGCRNNCDPLLK